MPASSPPLISELIAALDGDTATRLDAQAMLRARGPEAVEPLIEALQAPGRRGWAAAQVLGSLADPRSIEPLFVALHSESPLLSNAAATALITGFLALAAERLAAALPDVSFMAQQAIIAGLQHSKEPFVAEALMERLRLEPSPVNRCALIKALGALGATRALPLIRSFCEDPDAHTRQWAEKIVKQLEEADAKCSEPNETV